MTKVRSSKYDRCSGQCNTLKHQYNSANRLNVLLRTDKCKFGLVNVVRHLYLKFREQKAYSLVKSRLKISKRYSGPRTYIYSQMDLFGQG